MQHILQRPSSVAARVGDRVRVRRQRWLVTSVNQYDTCAVLTLSGQSEANLGVERQILTPFEHVDPLPQRQRPRIVHAARWRRVCRALIAHDGPADILRTAIAARMDLLPYQLEPALAIVRGAGSRVLIADDVGLGKTIQAGLIVSELRARGAATRVLILTPAGLREQWAEELGRRFTLRFSIFDTHAVSRSRSQLPVGVNPWTTETLVIASLDYVKRPEVFTAASGARWDVVVVDEAHHGATGTDRHRAVSAFCATAAYVVLLTATPHNGDPGAFASLCDIGRQDDPPIVFRRTREEAGLGQPRGIHQLRVTLNDAERHMHACLAAFDRAVQREHRERHPDVRLATATLRKRALSSAFALERSVHRRLEGLDASTASGAAQLTLPLDDLGDELDAADGVPSWTVPALGDPREERALLTRLAHAAAVAARDESKVAALRRLLRRVREPMLIFTEYRDTLIHLRNAIAPEAPVIHGGLTRDERRAAVASFSRSRVLLATDAAGEGLNLHHACRIVVNLELPWNPMRLEQRIGRVDRIGQRRRVHAFHLIAAGTSETRMLRRLEERVMLAQTAVGAADPLSSKSGGGHTTRGAAHAADRAVVTRLAEDAFVECQRLAMARRLALQEPSRPPASDRAILDGPLIAFAKRGAIKQQLLGRTLVIFRSALSDETGRDVGSQLIPVLIAGRCDRRRFLDELNLIGPDIVQRLPRACCEPEPIRATYDTFWTVRRDREVAIARWLRRAASREHQPGLFDRRADRESMAGIERTREAQIATDRHLQTIARALNLVYTPPRPALVLFP